MFGRKNSIKLKYKMYGFVRRHSEFLMLLSIAIIMTIFTVYTWEAKYYNQHSQKEEIPKVINQPDYYDDDES